MFYKKTVNDRPCKIRRDRFCHKKDEVLQFDKMGM